MPGYYRPYDTLGSERGTPMTLQSFFGESRVRLTSFLRRCGFCYLLYEGARCGADVKPYYIKTAFQQTFVYADIPLPAKRVGVEVTVLELPRILLSSLQSRPALLTSFAITVNAVCFQTLKDRAISDGYPIAGWHQCLRSGGGPPKYAGHPRSCLSVPLCGGAASNKAEIRACSKQAGLFAQGINRPYACRLLPAFNRRAVTGGAAPR